MCGALSSIECHVEGEAVTPEEEETEAQIRSHLFKWTYLLRDRVIYEENFLEPTAHR